MREEDDIGYGKTRHESLGNFGKKEISDIGSNKSLYSNTFKNDCNSTSDSASDVSEIENTCYPNVSKGSQIEISCNEFKQEYKTKILPDEVKNRVKNKWKEMLNKLIYSPNSLNSSCATDEFSYVASSPLAWDREDDDVTEDSYNDEKEEIQRKFSRKTYSHTTLQNKDGKKYYSRRDGQRQNSLFLFKDKIVTITGTLRRRQKWMKKKNSPPIFFVNKLHFSSEESEPENSSHYNQTSQQRHKLQKHDKLKRPERKNKSNSGLNETNRYIFSFKCFFLILFSSFNVPVFVISLSSFGSLKTSSPYIPTQTSRD